MVLYITGTNEQMIQTSQKLWRPKDSRTVFVKPWNCFSLAVVATLSNFPIASF